MDFATDRFVMGHDPGFVAVAAVLCLLGMLLTVRLLMRARAAAGRRRGVQIALTGLIGGATVWATHFVAMLSYRPQVAYGYDAGLTLLSLLVAVVGTVVSFYLARRATTLPGLVLCGVAFGGTVAAMHFTGMKGYLVQGRIEWSPPLVLASILVGMVFGAIGFHRVVRPMTRICWLGAVLGLAIAICAMHFTAMAALTVVADPSMPVPTGPVSDFVLGALVLGVMSVVLSIGLATFAIETNLTEETRSLLSHAAAHDQLTGLPNRRTLEQRLSAHDFRVDAGDARNLAILTLDLDLFKQVNDLYGHATGDALLRDLAARLRAILGEGEVLARTGGDEFVALKFGYRRPEEVRAFASRLQAQVLDPFTIAGSEVLIGVSIGIASWPTDGETSEQVLHHSDLAMYRAKTDPDRKIVTYNADMDRQSRDRQMLIHDLRHAILRNEFSLHYQLQNDLRTHDPVGFEALLRWTHPERGSISPADFIPIAEETGLIRDIGLWVLRTACAEAASWTLPFRIAVNVAPQQLIQPSFGRHVADILIDTGLDAGRLELEITEASIIDDQANALAVMHELKGMGIRIAMDDFGTGYSSLATLQAFPFDKIKIDRAFIDHVHAKPQRAAIVRSTLLLGSALRIPVLAEGVEKIEELDFLLAENCSEVQGFYFGKPMTTEDARIIAAGGSARRKAG